MRTAHRGRRPFTPVVALTLALLVGTFVTGAVTGPGHEARGAAPVAETQRARGLNVVIVMADDMRVDDLRFGRDVRRLVAGRGLTLRELLLAVPAVLPGAGVVPHRHATPTTTTCGGTGARYGLPAFDDSRTLATVAARRRLPAPGSSGSTSTATARCAPWSAADRRTATCRAAGPTGARSIDPRVRRRSRQHLQLLGHPAQRQRPRRQPPPAGVPDRRASATWPGGDGAGSPRAPAVLHVRLLRGPALRCPGDGRPADPCPRTAAGSCGTSRRRRARGRCAAGSTR